MEDAGLVFGRLNARWCEARFLTAHSRASSPTSLLALASSAAFVVRNGLDLKRFSLRPSGRGRGRKPCWPRFAFTSETLGPAAVGCSCPETLGISMSPPPHWRWPCGMLCNNRSMPWILQSVTLMGHQTDIPACLADATVLVHTSDSEGCPNAVMEAMACGRPVVAMGTGDIPFLIEDAKTGFIVPHGDESKACECLATLLTDP